MDFVGLALRGRQEPSGVPDAHGVRGARGLVAVRGPIAARHERRELAVRRHGGKQRALDKRAPRVGGAGCGAVVGVGALRCVECGKRYMRRLEKCRICIGDLDRESVAFDTHTKVSSVVMVDANKHLALCADCRMYIVKRARRTKGGAGFG